MNFKSSDKVIIGISYYCPQPQRSEGCGTYIKSVKLIKFPCVFSPSFWKSVTLLLSLSNLMFFLICWYTSYYLFLFLFSLWGFLLFFLPLSLPSSFSIPFFLCKNDILVWLLCLLQCTPFSYFSPLLSLPTHNIEMEFLY